MLLGCVFYVVVFSQVGFVIIFSFPLMALPCLNAIDEIVFDPEVPLSSLAIVPAAPLPLPPV